MRFKMKPIAATLIAFLGIALFSTAAQAATGNVYQGDDYAYVNNDAIVVCDMEVDGNAVWAEVHLINGQSMTVVDGNGSKSGCGRA